MQRLQNRATKLRRSLSNLDRRVTALEADLKEYAVPPKPLPPKKPERQAMSIGMNLHRWAAWSPQIPSLNVFLSSYGKGWLSQLPGQKQPWKTGDVVETTREGWPILKPGQAAGTVMCRAIGDNYPKGMYRLEFEGKGQIDFGFAARHADGGVEVTPKKSGIYMRVDASDSQDIVHNIRLWMPGMKSGEFWNPLFTRSIRPWRVLRFMDWQRTNKTASQRWQNRTLPGMPQSTRKGCCVEYMVDLCNRMMANPWFCIGHLWDDEYIRKFARFVRDGLHPRLKCHIEYSNEVWNPAMAVFHSIDTSAKAQGMSFLDTWASRANRAFRIFSEQWPERDRVVRVLAGQRTQPGRLERVYQEMDGNADAVACAAYFSAPMNESSTVSSVLSGCWEDLKTMPDQLGAYKHIFDKYGLRPLIYEGGQHLTAFGAEVPWQNVIEECQYVAEMEGLTDKVFGVANSVGFDLFCYFNDINTITAHGAWGLQTHRGQAVQLCPKRRSALKQPGARSAEHNNA